MLGRMFSVLHIQIIIQMVVGWLQNIFFKHKVLVIQRMHNHLHLVRNNIECFETETNLNFEKYTK